MFQCLERFLVLLLLFFHTHTQSFSRVTVISRPVCHLFDLSEFFSKVEIEHTSGKPYLLKLDSWCDHSLIHFFQIFCLSLNKLIMSASFSLRKCHSVACVCFSSQVIIFFRFQKSTNTKEDLFNKTN